MILFLAAGREVLLPARNRMDRIDHLLLWAVRLSLWVLFLTLPKIVLADQSPPERPRSDFFMACSGGDFEHVGKLLKEHPEWINARTENGESCLHLTGIYGYPQVTRTLLKEFHADPNIRSTFEDGLRMHPLSWNVYGGHLTNIEILLEYGADPNLDFDSMEDGKGPVTALDVVLQLQEAEDGDERFIEMEKILRDNGGKTMAELNAEKEAEL